MGLLLINVEFINRNMQDVLGGLSGKKMLEFGNQHIMSTPITERTGKEYYTKRGVEHISIDLNGEDGALVVDLSRELKNTQWHGYFDVVTDAGTSEHVEPYEGQYECFKTVHDCLKVGGIAVHILPDVHSLEEYGIWEGHCHNYYSLEFFKMLAEKNNYKLYPMKVISGSIYACYQKLSDAPFMTDRQEFLKYIAWREGAPLDKGKNVSEWTSLYRKIRNFLIEQLWAKPMIATRPLRRRLGLYVKKSKYV